MLRLAGRLLGTLAIAVVLAGCAAPGGHAQPTGGQAAAGATLTSPAAGAANPAPTPAAKATTPGPAPALIPEPTVAPSPTPNLPERTVCAGEGPLVALVVEPGLGRLIRPGLSRFEADLCAEGYAVTEQRADFATAAELRAYLAELYGRSGGRLAGAILAGDVPHAYQWVTLHSSNPSIAPTSQEALSFQYYADLDGTFAASPGYASPGGHSYSFDVHEGDVDWEIWVGVLPLYKGDLERTAEALERYFARNHAYRTGACDLPRAFLEIDEHAHATTLEQHEQLLAGMRGGQYAWTPFSSDPGARIYFDSPLGGLSVDQGYAGLSAGVADFTVLNAHGSPQASGRLSIAWAESQPVHTAFLWDTACAAGNLDQADNVLTSLLYSPTSVVLVAEGTTCDSGGFGSNERGFYGHNIASALAAGSSLGDAVLAHADVPLLAPWSDSRELHFAPQVILGDPTLRLR